MERLNLSYNEWIEFGKNTIEIIVDYPHEGGCVLSRDTEDVLNQKENDKRFIADFYNKVQKYAKSPEVADKAIDKLKTYDFVKHIDESAENYTPFATWYEVRHYINENYDEDLYKRASTFEEAKEILKACHNWRKPREGKKPFALGSGFIYKVEEYIINDLPVAYESMVFHSTHDCVPEKIYEWDAKPKRSKKYIW